MEKEKAINELDAQLRLAEVMNNTPREIKFGKKKFKLTALKPGTQYLIAEEAAKLAKAGDSFEDVIKRFAVSVPAVIRCLTLAILNDKDKINGKEYQDMYDYIQWETDPKQWLRVLIDVLQMLDLSFFFTTLEQIDLFRQMTLTKKVKAEAS
jgi:hypothetical protein